MFMHAQENHVSAGDDVQGGIQTQHSTPAGHSSFVGASHILSMFRQMMTGGVAASPFGLPPPGEEVERAGPPDDGSGCPRSASFSQVPISALFCKLCFASLGPNSVLQVCAVCCAR